MALYTRWVSVVDSATGSDVTASGSSASTKDTNASSTLVVTNAAGGSTVTKGDASAFSGPPVAGIDTLQFKDNSAGTENVYHITSVSGDNKTLTLIEAPASATADAADVWAVGGYFASIGRAATLVKPSNTNAGNDDHVYVKAASGYSGTAKITFSNAGSRSRNLVFEGYTTTAGDGGRAAHDITGTATIAFEPAAADQTYRNFKLTNSGGVNSWRGLGATSSWRGLADNVWTSSTSGTGPIGFNMPAAVVGVFRGRGTHTPAAGIGYQTSGIHLTAFSIMHDNGSHGWTGTLPSALGNIADTCGTGTASGGFFSNSASRCQLVFCTVYNQGTTGDGVRINDNAGSTAALVLGSILANNAGAAINRQGITAAFPLHMEAYNDLFGNGTSPARTNAEDTTGYNAAPTDVTSDPGFTDAANQDFSISTTLKGAAAIALQVGGTAYLDMGAVQRQEAAAGGGGSVFGAIGGVIG